MTTNSLCSFPTPPTQPCSPSPTSQPALCSTSPNPLSLPCYSLPCTPSLHLLPPPLSTLTEPLEYRKYTFASGAIYEGYFCGSKRHGCGYWRHPEGEEFEGQYKNNKPDGLGVYIFSHGQKYIGEWREGVMNGKGVYFFRKNELSYYVGGYERDQKHGTGYYRYETGLTTSQKWEHNVLVSEFESSPVDQVRAFFALLEILAHVKKVAPHLLPPPVPLSDALLSPRAFQFPSGATYEGESLGSSKWGVGSWSHPQGDCYQGQFENNKFNGWGVYVSGRTGKKYVGHWGGGKMDGWGIYFFNREETEFFWGEYRDDKREGRGLYHFAESGKSLEQWYEKGELKGEGEVEDERVGKYVEAMELVIIEVQKYARGYRTRWQTGNG